MKYWVYINGQVPGCYLPGELAQLSGFTQTSLVCPAEGEISEKNWRRAGEFSELAVVVDRLEKARPPMKPAEAPPAIADVDKLIDTSSQRLFGHVAELMKELQDRREDKSLVESLQRQLAAFRADLQTERERNAINENRVARIADLEDVHRRDLDTIAKLDSSVRDRDERLSALHAELEKLKYEFDATRRRLGETANDLAIRNSLVDKISKDLTEKELSLAKSLAVIRRLEEDLHRIVPAPLPQLAAPMPLPSLIKEAAEQPAIPAPPPFQAPLHEPEVPRPVFSPVPELIRKEAQAEPLLEEHPPEPKQELSLPEAPAPVAAPAPAEPPKRATTKSWLRKAVSAPSATPKKEFTDDEPPSAPPILEPDPEKLGAQNALVEFFRKVMGKDHKPEA